jgi:CelD/BcsL family acetyltransferase involved in cellulose biosynthesis
MSIDYALIPARDLPTEYVGRMAALADENPALASPFFQPQYAQTVAEVRDGIDMVVLASAGRAVGFYPFERMAGDVGRPVGGGMSNCQGVIAAAGTEWSAQAIAQAAGVRTLGFHHQIAEQHEFDPFVTQRAEAPVIDLAGGWDGFLAARNSAGVSSFNALPRKIRRLEREVGPISFVPRCSAPEAFDRLIEWKRAQYAQGSLHQEWSVEVLRRLMAIDTPGFVGMLSALYAGDRLLAVHAGIRARRVWHYWYPSYDPELGRHSPGLVLIWEMCRWAADAGIARIDLGPGAGAHKDLFANSEMTVGVGEIVVTRAARALWRLTHLRSGR